MQAEGWKPDYIVGLIKGGMLPAALISEWLNVPCYTLNVQLPDENSTETNLWMAEDAFGFGTDYSQNLENRKNILIVNDVNNHALIEWIKSDWQGGCLPHDSDWDKIWHNTTKFAVLVDNVQSDTIVDYNAIELNDAVPSFPWDNWWEKTTS